MQYQSSEHSSTEAEIMVEGAYLGVMAVLSSKFWSKLERMHWKMTNFRRKMMSLVQGAVEMVMADLKVESCTDAGVRSNGEDLSDDGVSSAGGG